MIPLPPMHSIRCKQLQVCELVITGIAIDVVDDFFCGQIPSKMLFYDDTMLKGVLGARGFGLTRRWVVIRDHDPHIAIGSMFSPALPSRCPIAPLPKHPVR
jgi:hypothetical protein